MAPQNNPWRDPNQSQIGHASKNIGINAIDNITLQQIDLEITL